VAVERPEVGFRPIAVCLVVSQPVVVQPCCSQGLSLLTHNLILDSTMNLPTTAPPPTANCRPRRKTARRCAMVAWLGLATAAFSAVAEKPKAVTDEQITNAVDYKLLTDAALLNNQIFATTKDGIVTLAGTADHLIAKERAVKLAQTLRGVRGVVNTITLDIPAVPDAELQSQVQSALRYDAATDSYEIRSEAKDGVVTISGTVQSYYEMQLAEFVVKSVKGVRELKDNITVQVKDNRPDVEILAEVKRIISNDVWLDPNFISTAVAGGVVTLSGAVGSVAQFDRASMLAWTAGVKAVNVVALQIEPWAKSSGQRSEVVAVKDDPEILKAVKDSFVIDPRVYAFNPSVGVQYGVVTLTGVVDNLKAKRAAEQDAKNTTGVWRVKNLLKVRPVLPLTDEIITQNVNAALSQNPFVDSYEVSAKAKRGVVTLIGTVHSHYERAEAEDVASRTNGVLDVKNNIAVNAPSIFHYDTSYYPYWNYGRSYLRRPIYDTPWTYTSDREVKYDIEDQLFWSPWVDRDDITVKVENGTATLTGRADSWFEYNQATDKAFEGGARQVFNNIVIE